MINDANKPKRPQAGERRLAIAGILLFAAILAVSGALWVRHGEEIFFSRIVSAIQSCL